MAFDKHMNIVLADTDEFRRVGGKKGKEEKVIKRSLGLIILRGEIIVSMSVEGPPPPEEAARARAAQGPQGASLGMGRAAGRGLAVPPVPTQQSLGAPPRGLGGPQPGMMIPRGMPFQGPPRGAPAPVQAMAPRGAPPPGGAPAFRGGPPPMAGRPGATPGVPQQAPPGGAPPGFRGGPPPGAPPGYRGMAPGMPGGPPPGGGMPPGYRGGPPPAMQPPGFPPGPMGPPPQANAPPQMRGQ